MPSENACDYYCGGTHRQVNSEDSGPSALLLWVPLASPSVCLLLAGLRTRSIGGGTTSADDEPDRRGTRGFSLLTLRVHSRL